MLSGLQRFEGMVTLVRLTSSRKRDDALAEMGIDPDDIAASDAYFANLDVSPEAHLEWVFRTRDRGLQSSRFSNGLIPVLYCAADQETCQREIAHWISEIPGVVVYYQALAVEFSGAYVDLHALSPQPSCLTGEKEAGSYEQCLEITKEALAIALDGFKTPSARHAGGCCFPVFSRHAVVGLTPLNHVHFKYDEAMRTWTGRAP